MPLDNSSYQHTLEIRWAKVAEIRKAVTEQHALAHWRESGTNQDELPLDPDWQEYLRLERIGAYKCLTAWRGTKLAGYAGYLVTPSSLQHRTTPHALNISIYTAPWARGIGGLMVRRAVHEFAELVRPRRIRVVHEAPITGKFGPVLEALGFEKSAEVYQKVVCAA